jgi:hypothetical protein
VQEIIELLALLAGSAAALIASDTLALRLAANPSPDRKWTIRGISAFTLLATLGLYGSIFFLMGMLAVFGAKALVGNGAFGAKSLIAAGVLGGYALAAFGRNQLRGAAVQLSSPARSTAGTADAKLQNTNVGAATPWFVAMEYYALMLNRTYKVFVADRMLCGANVRGLVASPPSASSEMIGADYWAGTLAATLYETMDVTEPRFLRMGWANFQIPYRAIARVEVNTRPKWGMGNVPYSGRIILWLRSGRTRELILLGEQDAAAIKGMLEERMATNRA